MSVDSDLNRVQISGSGTITPIAFNRKVFAATDIVGSKEVTATGVVTSLVQGTDYSVTGAGNTSTGVTITPLIAPAVGERWVFWSDQANTQASVYTENDRFPAKTTEYALDKQSIGIQDQSRYNDLALRYPDTEDSSTSGALPVVNDRKSKALGFDANGDISMISVNNVSSSNASGITYDPAGAGAVPTTVEAKLRESVSVKDFGAIGDGVADDTAAIQAAIDATFSLGGGTVFLPVGSYRITDTLDIGFWSINGAGDVLGFAASKAGFQLKGERRFGTNTGYGFKDASLFWDGGLQAGDNAVTLSDSIGTYTFIDNAKPMISVVGGRLHFFDGISMHGNDEAHAGIQFDGNYFINKIENCNIYGCKIAVRQTIGIRHDTYGDYYGYADSPWYKANVYDAPSFGGFGSDNTTIRGCHFERNETAVSCESAQALSCIYDSLWISGSTSPTNFKGKYGFINAGGHLNLRGCGVGGSLTYGLWHITKNSFIIAQEFHDESNATYSYRSSTTPGTSAKMKFFGGDVGDISMGAGDGSVIIEGLNWGGGLTRAADNSSTEVTQITVDNVRCTKSGGNMIDLGTVADKSNVLMNVRNVELVNGAAVTASYGSFVGEISSLVPEGTYTEFRGHADRTTFVKELTNGVITTDGHSTRFSGKKTSIPDETNTVLCTFDPGASNFYKVTMDVQVQTGSSPNMAVLAETISFIVGANNVPTQSASAVVVDSTVSHLVGFASIAATFTLNVAGSNIELIINQNNETADASATCTYTGTIVGGVSGGSTPLGLFAPN